jgi:hypothetical protein
MHAAPIELKLEMPPPPHVVVNMVEPAAQPPAVHDPLTHVEPAAQGVPQPPQLLASLAKSTHAPLQSAVPLLQVKPHELLVQVAVALATEVEQAWPHVLQLLMSLDGSTQLPLQSIGAIVGQPDAHEYEAVAPTHTGVLPLQPLPQVPQLLEVVS